MYQRRAASRPTCCKKVDVQYDKFATELNSGVTERLGALGHINTRGLFAESPVTLMSVLMSV